MELPAESTSERCKVHITQACAQEFACADSQQ